MLTPVCHYKAHCKLCHLVCCYVNVETLQCKSLGCLKWASLLKMANWSYILAKKLFESIVLDQAVFFAKISFLRHLHWQRSIPNTIAACRSFLFLIINKLNLKLLAELVQSFFLFLIRYRRCQCCCKKYCNVFFPSDPIPPDTPTKPRRPSLVGYSSKILA